ncbi:MAG: AAA family ATPase [Cyclobacteriaceae bacterium]|jgi:HTH-type transcriptional repressor of NAD biosynthesis genes|nr:AAA family ATPase [Cyclobacteriaceae bacterium]
MTRALVIGKFMPVHRGHISLIEFAAQQADEVIVSMSDTPTDPIPGDLRFRWLQQLFEGRANIVVARVEDTFDNPALPLVPRTKIWADFLSRRYPQVSVVVSSEAYGEPLARHLGARHVLYDMARARTPVSATQIREAPFRHWAFIPEVVRPYFVKLICLYGPESTGKSTLSKQLAEEYQTVFVPEVAREIVTSNSFTVDDIIKIGRAQTQRVNDLRQRANKFLFCDTDVITTQIYSNHYLGVVPPVLYELEKEMRYDQYFLLYPDVAWVADGLRDLGERRVEMFDVFKHELVLRSIPYHLIQGDWNERFTLLKNTIEKRYR